MSLASASAERDRLKYLLQLAHEQIKALEADDSFALDRILAARGAIIDSLGALRAPDAAAPTLRTMAAQIQECDRSAPRLLPVSLWRAARRR